MTLSARLKDHPRLVRLRLAVRSAFLGLRIFNRFTLLGPIRNLRLGCGVRIDPGAVLDVTGGPLSIGRGSRVHRYAVLAPMPGGRIAIGEHCSINPFCVLYGHGGLTIGNDVRIAAHTVFVPANHVFADPDTPIREQGLTRRGIRVDDDVWIGAGVQILDGVTIGRGAVVAAGAVVNRAVAPCEIVGGVPARAIGSRLGANRRA